MGSLQEWDEIVSSCSETPQKKKKKRMDEAATGISLDVAVVAEKKNKIKSTLELSS